MNIYRKIWKNFLQDEISPTNISAKPDPKKKNFLLRDNSLQINFQWNKILSTNHLPSNKFQHNIPFCFPLFFKTWFGIKWPGRLICRKKNRPANQPNKLQVTTIFAALFRYSHHYCKVLQQADLTYKSNSRCEKDLYLYYKLTHKQCHHAHRYCDYGGCWKQVNPVEDIRISTELWAWLHSLIVEDAYAHRTGLGQVANGKQTT